MAIRDKTKTNKWTYERSHKSLNSYLLVEYNKIYPNTNSWKTLKEESLWQEDFNNLHFWNTLNETHHDIIVWNIYKRLHTIYKRRVHKERKETTHVKVGERTIITTSSYIKHHKYMVCYHNVRTMYLQKKKKKKNR